MCLSTGASIVNIKERKNYKYTFKQYNQKHYKLCLSTGASIVKIKKKELKLQKFFPTFVISKVFD